MDLSGKGRSLDSPDVPTSSVGPQSPPDAESDATSPMSSENTNPRTPSSPGCSNAGYLNSLLGRSPNSLPYPQNHPLFGGKHVCAICGDSASGKHYGAYSCEGCKGFFKRTVRKDLTYVCRNEKSCTIDERHRNRCQYCRYQKCLSKGMKREAVQEGRQRTKEHDNSDEIECIDHFHNVQNVITYKATLAAEEAVEYPIDLEGFYHSTTSSLFDPDNIHPIQLVKWSRLIPHFNSLHLDDQIALLRAGWNELLIITMCYRSKEFSGIIVLPNGLTLHRESPMEQAMTLFDEVVAYVYSMRALAVDKTEYSCLKAMILINPRARGLSCENTLDIYRTELHETLGEYINMTRPNDIQRFAKLLLLLPSFRTASLKFNSYLFCGGDTRDSSHSYINGFIANLLTQS